MTRRRARRSGLLIGVPVLAGVVVPALVARPGWVIVAALVLCVLAMAIAVHDLTSMLIPDRYTAGLALVAIMLLLADGAGFAELSWQIGTAACAVAALFLFSLLYGRLRGLDAIGFGDIKLLGASALLVGVWGVGLQLLLACTAAAIFVVIRSVRRGRRLRFAMRIPFGAFLAPALVIIWAWAPIR